MGAVLVTLALALLNHYLDGTYNFYKPSVSYAFEAVQQSDPAAAKDVAVDLARSLAHLTADCVLLADSSRLFAI